MNNQKLSQWGVCMGAALVLSTTAVGAADKRGPGAGGGGKGNGPVIVRPDENEVQNMFQTLVAIRQGDYQGVKAELRQAIRSVPFSPSASVISGLLQQSLVDSNNFSLSGKDKVILVVDQVSTALTLATAEKAKEWNDKSEMRGAIRYIRIAKLISQKGFEGKAVSCLIQAETELMEFERAPAIRRALEMVQQAKNKIDNGQTGPLVQSLLQSAMDTIRDSRVFNK